MKKEENEYLTQVGPGTPMGDLLRRFWMPVMLETEVPAPNEPPVPSRVMGEDCLVWRDASGEVGLFQKYCMHRRVSLTLARCEGDGLRCIFHGWKFSTSGRVLEVPNEQPDSTLKTRLRAPVYPTRLAGGLLWAYLGPPDRTPAFPHYAFMDAAEDQRYGNRIIWNANFVQGIEGNIDSSHIGILHNDVPFFGARREHVPADTPDTFLWDDDSPTIVVEDHRFGFVVAAIRKGVFNGKESLYGRVHNYIFPCASIVPAPGSPIYAVHVPIDDENTMTFNVLYSDGPLDKNLCGSIFRLPDALAEELSPEVQRYLGSPENNWFQDRSIMDNIPSGLRRPISQDLAVLSAQGPITDRSKQIMLSSDVAIRRMHRMLIAGAENLEQGIEPAIPSQAESGSLACGEGMLDNVSDWSKLLMSTV